MAALKEQVRALLCRIEEEEDVFEAYFECREMTEKVWLLASYLEYVKAILKRLNILVTAHDRPAAASVTEARDEKQERFLAEAVRRDFQTLTRVNQSIRQRLRELSTGDEKLRRALEKIARNTAEIASLLTPAAEA